MSASCPFGCGGAPGKGDCGPLPVSKPGGVEMVSEQLLEGVGEAPGLRFGETADGESPGLLLDFLPRRVRNRSLTDLASSRSARFFFLSSSEMLMSGSWSFTKSMTCPVGSTEVSEAVETFRCRWESLRWGLGALLIRFRSVSPSGELASPVRMIVGRLRNGLGSGLPVALQGAPHPQECGAWQPPGWSSCVCLEPLLCQPQRCSKRLALCRL